MGLRKFFFKAAEKIDSRLEQGVSKLPQWLKAIFVLVLGGLAGEADWEDKRLLSYVLLGFGLFVSLSAFTFGKRKGHKE